jgi:hypothetical protein
LAALFVCSFKSGNIFFITRLLKLRDHNHRRAAAVQAERKSVSLSEQQISSLWSTRLRLETEIIRARIVQHKPHCLIANNAAMATTTGGTPRLNVNMMMVIISLTVAARPTAH